MEAPLEGERPTGVPRGDFDVREMLASSVRMCYEDRKTFLGMAAVAGLPFLISMFLSMFRERDFAKAMRSPGQGFIELMTLALVVAGFVPVVKYMDSVPLLTAFRLDDRPMSWTEAFTLVRDRELF